MSQFHVITSLTTPCWNFGCGIVVLLVISLAQDDTTVVILIGINWLVKLGSIVVTSIKIVFF